MSFHLLPSGEWDLGSLWQFKAYSHTHPISNTVSPKIKKLFLCPFLINNSFFFPPFFLVVARSPLTPGRGLQSMYNKSLPIIKRIIIFNRTKF